MARAVGVGWPNTPGGERRAASVVCVVCFLAACHVVVLPSPVAEGVDYAEVEEACSTSWARENLDEGLVGEFGIPISEECVGTIGRIVLIDWATFDDEPREIATVDGTLATVITALLLAVSPFGTMGQSVVEEHAPHDFVVDIDALSGDGVAPDAMDAGEVWFHYLRAHISGVEYTGSNDYGMSYPGDGTVLVGDILDLNPPDDYDGIWVRDDPISPVTAAGMLAHEAAHAFMEPHRPCQGEESATSLCDATPNGAYGVGIWWLDHWRIYGSTSVSVDICSDVQDTFYWWCGSIDDIGDWPPCLDESMFESFQ